MADKPDNAPTFSFDHGGETYTIPAFAALNMGTLRKARKGKDDMDTTFIILESVLSEDDPALAAIDEMGVAEFTDFIKGWTQGAGLGEA